MSIVGPDAAVTWLIITRRLAVDDDDDDGDELFSQVVPLPTRSSRALWMDMEGVRSLIGTEVRRDSTPNVDGVQWELSKLPGTRVQLNNPCPRWTISQSRSASQPSSQSRRLKGRTRELRTTSSDVFACMPTCKSPQRVLEKPVRRLSVGTINRSARTPVGTEAATGVLHCIAFG